jgi:hypothetical protein
MRDARADDRIALLTVDAQPDTVMLLDLLSDRATRGARSHLRAARTWRGQQNRKAMTKFNVVQTALDGLDVSLAKGLLRKMDSRILGGAELARFDELLLATEALTLELEDIEKQVPSSSSNKQRRRGRFKKG